jgi:hypothetical protein
VDAFTVIDRDCDDYIAQYDLARVASMTCFMVIGRNPPI